MVHELKKSPQTYPYPHKFDVKLSVKDFIEKYEAISEKGVFHEEETSVAGRVTNIRIQGKNLIFYDIVGDGKKLQVMCNVNNHKADIGF